MLRSTHAGLAFLVALAGCVQPAARGGAAVPAANAHVSPESKKLGELLRSSDAVRPFADDHGYRLQVLVAVPTSDGRGLRREGFEVDATYFYPASTVKLCSAVAALERMTELRTEGPEPTIDVHTPLEIDGKVTTRTSLASSVDRALVFSDNEAHNLLFDFVGQDDLHDRMWRLGLDSVRIRHRLATPAGDDPREAPSFKLHADGREPFVIPARTGRVALGRNDMNGVLVGEEHLSGGSVVSGPMSFEAKNRGSLVDLQELLVAVVRPELRSPPSPRLGAEERAILLDALATSPSDRGARASADAEHKPLRAGVARVLGAHDLVAYGKSGRAYGFMVDNAYFFDKATGKAFFLAAAVYANANGRVADDVYDYRSVAFPLLAAIGELIARAQLEAKEPLED